MIWPKNVLNLLRKADTKPTTEQGRLQPMVGDYYQPPACLEEAHEFFKEAAECHMTGDPQTAIDLFGKGLNRYAATNGLVPEDILLRLPNYLKAAGRRQEAWDEYYRIIGLYAGYDQTIRPMVFAKVYDKMRFFQHREKNFTLAIVYAALSYVAWRKGLCLQKRFLELEGWQLRVTIEHGLGRSYRLIDPKQREQIVKLIREIGPTLEELDFLWFEQRCLKIVTP